MRITSGTRARHVMVALLLTALIFGAVRPANAIPSTAQLEEQRALADGARAQLEEYAALAELRHEEYAQAAAELEAARAEVDTNRARVAVATDELERVQDALAARVSSIYRSDPMHFFELLLGTSTFRDLITRIDWFRRISLNDADLVRDVGLSKDELESSQRALERREGELVLLRSQAEARRTEVDTALANQERYISQLDTEIARIVAEEEERIRREAEERAQRAAAEAARMAAQAQEAARNAAIQSGANSRVAGQARVAQPNGRAFDPDALGQGNPQAVTVGLRYLGVPYLWGGSTPEAFDCSGLTQWVFREIGVSIPRNSRQQFRVGAFIPPDRRDLLLPGDLVFFGRDGDPGRVHHVGIYIGAGDYLHAPRTGVPVRVDSLDSRIERRNDYVGATRP